MTLRNNARKREFARHTYIHKVTLEDYVDLFSFFRHICQTKLDQDTNFLKIDAYVFISVSKNKLQNKYGESVIF